MQAINDSASNPFSWRWSFSI